MVGEQARIVGKRGDARLICGDSPLEKRKKVKR